MTDTITLTGLVATVPRHLTTGEGLHITSFRLASSQRRYDRASNAWVDGDTNWYTVSTFRRLAAGAAASVSKGDRIIVTGRLRMRDWKSTDKAGTTVEVDAEALGHDLNWGTATFTRSMAATTVASADAAGADPIGALDGGANAENGPAGEASPGDEDEAAAGWSTDSGPDGSGPDGSEPETPF